MVTVPPSHCNSPSACCLLWGPLRGQMSRRASLGTVDMTPCSLRRRGFTCTNPVGSTDTRQPEDSHLSSREPPAAMTANLAVPHTRPLILDAKRHLDVFHLLSGPLTEPTAPSSPDLPEAPSSRRSTAVLTAGHRRAGWLAFSEPRPWKFLPDKRPLPVLSQTCGMYRSKFSPNRWPSPNTQGWDSTQPL